MKFKTYYRRHLPHYQHDGATYFVTTRLQGSLPNPVIERLREEHAFALHLIASGEGSVAQKRLAADQAHRRYFGRFDEQLDSYENGPHDLKIHEVARLVCDSLHHRHGSLYELICFCIMSNHLHLIFRIRQENFAVHRVMQSLKQFTAKEVNKYLNRSGRFWQDENYDRIVRDENELQRVINYVLNNPVKAGLCATWQDWPYTYLNVTYA